MGAWDLAGGIASSLISGYASNKNTKDTNKTNLQISRENNALQQKIAKENNQLQVDMMRENNAYSRDLALEMFNLENDYNSPGAQKERLLEAGINPYSMMNGGNVANTGDISTPSSAGSSVSPSMPSFVTPKMETPPSILGAMFGNFESITRSLSNLSSSGLNEAQRTKISSLLTAELDHLLKSNENLQVSNQVKKFAFELDKFFQPLERDKGLEKVANEAYKIYQDGLLAAAKQDTEKAEQLFKDAQMKLTKAESNKIDKLLPFLVSAQEETVNLIKEEQNTEKSKQASNYASANLSNAYAGLANANKETIDKLRESEVKIKNYLANKEQFAWQLMMTWKDELISAYGEQLKSSGLSNDMLTEQIRLFENKNEWADALNFMEALSGYTKSLSDVKNVIFDKRTIKHVYGTE